MSERQKCGCGNTKNVDGYCDGSHKCCLQWLFLLNTIKEEADEKPNLKNISENISKKVVGNFYGKIKSRVAWNPDMDLGHALPTEKEIERILQEEVQKELEYMLDYLR